MASGDATVKVRLDTRKAKQDLRKVGKEGHAAAGRVNAKLNRTGGGLGGGFGLGAGAAAGFGAVSGVLRSATSGPIGDFTSEFFAEFNEGVEQALGASDARQEKRTREEAAQIYAGQVAETGDTTLAKEWAARVLPHRKEIGRAEVDIRKDLAGESTAIKDAMDSAVVKVLSRGFMMLEDFKQWLGMGGGR